MPARPRHPISWTPGASCVSVSLDLHAHCGKDRAAPSAWKGSRARYGDERRRPGPRARVKIPHASGMPEYRDVLGR